MDFAQKNVDSRHKSTNHPNELAHDATFKKCLLYSVWVQSRLVASLLDQVGLAYHRVFSSQALELFMLLINSELSVCYSLDNFKVNGLAVLNSDLLTVHSKLISSMDLFVVEAFNNAEKQTSKTSALNKVLGKHHEWKSCAKSRFEQVICPILEEKLINKPS